MKAWNNQTGKWFDREEKYQAFLSDEDGYCTCSSCQYQKNLLLEEKNKLPEELFEL